MIDILKPRPMPVPLIKEVYAIVTADQPDGSACEGIIAMEHEGQSLPLVTPTRALIDAMWEGLTTCDDDDLKGRTYRLIKISGRREVLQEKAL